MMLLSTAAIGLTTGAAMSSSYAADVEKKMAWSGFVNRVVISGDDGVNNFISHSDPSGVAQSRGRIKASAASENLTVGALIELGLSNGANATQTANGAAAFSVRHSMLYFKNSMGTLNVGHTSHAAESVTVVDNSGTGLASSLNGSPFDGVLFHDSSDASGNAAAGTAVGNAHGADYSGGRASGITYVTPKLNGLEARVSHVTDASAQYAVKYGGDFNGVKLSAVYSYANVANSVSGGVDYVHGGGAGIELGSGFNISSSYREESRNSTSTADDGNNWTTKVGYKMSGVSDLGGTNVAVMYKKSENATASNDEYEEVALLVSQSLSDYGTEVYGGITNMDYDTTATNFDDITGIFMGARISF